MKKGVSDIINSIHPKSKPISSLSKRSEQPIIVGGASIAQTKAFEKIACAVADLAADTGGVPATRRVDTTMSVQGGGSLAADRTISLVNDEANPGIDKYYGTDSAGIKGYHDMVGGVGGANLAVADRTDENLTITSDSGTDAIIPKATDTLAGLMTADDKDKLDGVSAGAEANVQSDWNEADPTNDAYIKNKPSISDTGIIFSLADETPVIATVGDRGMASAGTDADKTYETSQEIDPLTGDTTSQTFTGDVVFDGATVDSTDTIYNHDGDTINNVDTVTNNDATSNINNNGNTTTNTNTTENNVGATVNNDTNTEINNTGTEINNTDVTTNYDGDNVNNYLDGSTVTNNQDGTVTNNYDEDYIENNTYEEGATVNNTGDLINNNTNYSETNNNTNAEVTNNGGVVNNNSTTENNTGVTNNYDEDSVNNFEGDIYIGGDIINLDTNSNNGGTVTEEGGFGLWNNLPNVLTCDGLLTTQTVSDPTNGDYVQLVVDGIRAGSPLTTSSISGNPGIYGSASEMRNLSLTPAMVNESDFGVSFRYGDSTYILVTNFGFNIPLVNTITGIKVSVIYNYSTPTISVDCITMTIYHTDGGTIQTGIQSIVAGTDINVDNTDPLNPIVSYTGTGGATDIGSQYLVLDGTLVDIGATAELVITDSRITDVTPYLAFFETEPVGNITKTLVNGSLTITSDNDADTLYVKVVFLDIGPSRQYMKGTATLTGAPGVVATILDPRFDTTTAGAVMPITAPVGYVTAVMSAGQMDISSTGTEVGCVVNRVVFLDTTNYSDGMAYQPTLDDDDMFFRKGQSGDDEAVKWSDMKGEINPTNTGTVFVSEEFATLPTSGDIITHNLGVTQADIEKGRYEIKISAYWIGGCGITQNIGQGETEERHFWSSGNPSSGHASRQANTLKIFLSTNLSLGDIRNARIIINKVR